MQHHNHNMYIRHQHTQHLQLMGFGKKVRIARPPPGFEAWVDKKAEIVTLLPKANHPLLYKVRDENGKSLTLPADALEPCKIDRKEEEVNTHDGYRYLIVNRLMYCLEHELEVCGKCGVDHRSTNFFIECTEDNAENVVEEWLEDMAKLGAPSRRAPTKKSKAGFPGNPAPFHPAISDHLFLLDTSSIFDPSTCNPWPPGVSTEAAMRRHIFARTDGPMPDLAKLPVRRVRETLVVLARRWEQFFQIKSRNEPMCRMLLQDEAHSEVMILDLILPVRVMMISGIPVPVFAVRWMHCRLTDGRHALQAISESMVQGAQMGDIEVEVDEIQLLAKILEENSKRVDSSFIQEEEQMPLSVSALTSISAEMQELHYAST